MKSSYFCGPYVKYAPTDINATDVCLGIFKEYGNHMSGSSA